MKRLLIDTLAMNLLLCPHGVAVCAECVPVLVATPEGETFTATIEEIIDQTDHDGAVADTLTLLLRTGKAQSIEGFTYSLLPEELTL